MTPPGRVAPHSPDGPATPDAALERDAWELHKVLSDLVRVYQFRDRTRICFYDVSVTQCYALSHLVQRGPLSLGGLAAALYLDKSTSSRVMNALIRKGYASRAEDSRDRRAVVLSATEKGRKLHSQIERDLVGEVRSLLADYDSDVRQATTSLIARLARTARARFSR